MPASQESNAHQVANPLTTETDLVGESEDLVGIYHKNDDEDFVAFTSRGDGFDIPQTAWRWELKGHGKYKGRYYNWRCGSGKYRKYRKGGYIETAQVLPPRPGKGNRTKRSGSIADRTTVDGDVSGGGNKHIPQNDDDRQQTSGGSSFAVYPRVLEMPLVDS